VASAPYSKKRGKAAGTAGKARRETEMSSEPATIQRYTLGTSL